MLAIFTPSIEWEKKRRLIRLEKMINNYAKGSSVPKAIENLYLKALRDCNNEECLKN